jgi:hypothetical protein
MAYCPEPHTWRGVDIHKAIGCQWRPPFIISYFTKGPGE